MNMKLFKITLLVFVILSTALSFPVILSAPAVFSRPFIRPFIQVGIDYVINRCDADGVQRRSP